MDEKQIVNELLDIRNYVISSDNFICRAAALEKLETMIELLTSDRIQFTVKRWYE